MIKDNERFFYRLHVVIDAFVIAFSYLFACFLQLGFFIEKDIGRLTTEEYLLPLFFVVPGLLLLYYAFNLYTSKRVQGRRLEIDLRSPGEWRGPRKLCKKSGKSAGGGRGHHR